MMEPPREEVDYTSLYKTFLSRETPLPLICFDSRVGEVPRCRLPFPPDRSGFSWNARLERAKEDIPRAIFRPTRPKTFKRPGDYQTSPNVTFALEIPTKRGRGRPKKEPTAAYKNENYETENYDGTDVNVQEIGIIRPERHYLRNNSIKLNDFCEYDLDDQGTLVK